MLMLILFAGLKSISRCSNLSSLKLGICLNISDEGLSHVGMKCTKLTELDLYRYLVAIPDFLSVQISLCFVAICLGSSQWILSN